MANIAFDSFVKNKALFKCNVTKYEVTDDYCRCKVEMVLGVICYQCDCYTRFATTSNAIEGNWYEQLRY